MASSSKSKPPTGTGASIPSVASAMSACGSQPQTMGVLGSQEQQAMEGQSSQQPIAQTTCTSDVNAEPGEPQDDGKRKLTSKVWESYKREKIDGSFKAICNFCNRKLGGETKNGTKHLHDHLKRCPKRRQMDMKQTLVSQVPKGDGKINLANYMFDQEVSRKELAKMIVLHEFPLKVVEYEGFRSYCRSLQPIFLPVSRQTIKRDIMALYECEKSKARKVLMKNRSRVAIMTDMWTSSNQKKGFMVVTAHFIDDSWALQSRVIRFMYVPSPHTTEVLTGVLMGCLIAWNIDIKLCTVTLDICSTNDAMVDSLLTRLNLDFLLLNGSLFHMRCSAHILNLIVKDGLDIIGAAIERIRDSVLFWTASPKREQKFEETVRQLRIPFTKKLCLDCKTRWNSPYLMLNSAIPCKDAFHCLKQRDSLYKSVPSKEDWEMARQICAKLQLFYKITELFSGTKYPTANLFFPHICEIKLKMSEWLIDSNAVIRDMAEKMLEKFNKYWSVIHGILGVVVVLDPRYKLRLLNFYFKRIYSEEEALHEIARVKQYFYDLLNQYKSEAAMQSDLTSEPTTSSLDVGDASGELELECLKDFYLEISKDSNADNFHSEFDLYLDEGSLPIVQNFDILNWWKTNGLRFPTLQRIARDILAIPVSTVASESAFSTSGRLVTPNHNRLHPQTVEALMCTQNWLWAELRDLIVIEQEKCPTVEDEESDSSDEAEVIEEN